MTNTQDDVEYLRNLPKDWWKNQDTVILVGQTLEKYGLVHDPWHFMEKPKTFQVVIDDFVKEWKDTQ